MLPLRDWSRRRVLFVSAIWILGSSVALFVAREWIVRRAIAASQAAMAADLPAVSPDRRQAFLPSERGDIYVVLPRGAIAGLVAFVLGPAAGLLLAWNVSRAKRRPQPA